MAGYLTYTDEDEGAVNLPEEDEPDRTGKILRVAQEEGRLVLHLSTFDEHAYSITFDVDDVLAKEMQAALERREIT